MLALSLLFLSAYAAAHPTAQQLTEQVRHKGAQAVISGLYANDEKEWQYITGEIGKGGDDWLKVATLLAPGSDADSAETLSEAVGMAIPHNPSGVLSIITERYTPLSIGEVCGLPFYSMTEPQLNQYIVDSIRALYKVPSSKACIDAMVNVIGTSNGFNEDN
ncbi:TPA: hypothetical protein MFS34_25430 [Klebsiella pneumoniae]|nr:hypothetical protein [Klebsiella pneumoniae]HDT4783465.1 hypothetical protein [Klebsiella pneumoniae subsp. pneumoniae]HBW9476037.1 hypothetical protein [Klebsiella pneumoniae]HBW9545128.1 hypothetical protein [Klebsiella pneumoniae]HBW9550497.1 hypothetical protein [Klebsiella pneumoniae]